MNPYDTCVLRINFENGWGTRIFCLRKNLPDKEIRRLVELLQQFSVVKISDWHYVPYEKE